MSYQHEHIPFLEPKEGYNLVANVYHTYHKKLNARDQAAVKTYLPRSLQGLSVLDLWGGDGRRALRLQWSGFTSRTIVDIAQAMLDKAPQRTHKVCADLREPIPLLDASCDLVLCTFVLWHIDMLETLMREARRCIRPSGRMLVVYHHERRPFVHHLHEGAMKIKTRHRREEEVVDELQAAGWQVDVFPIDEATNIYCCFPN